MHIRKKLNIYHRANRQKDFVYTHRCPNGAGEAALANRLPAAAGLHYGHGVDALLQLLVISLFFSFFSYTSSFTRRTFCGARLRAWLLSCGGPTVRYESASFTAERDFAASLCRVYNQPHACAARVGESKKKTTFLGGLCCLTPRCLLH